MFILALTCMSEQAKIMAIKYDRGYGIGVLGKLAAMDF